MESYESLEPFVLNSDEVKSWPLANQDLASLFHSVPLTARFGPRNHPVGHILWETESPRRSTTAEDFIAWAEGRPSSIELPSSGYWGYVDYTYILHIHPQSSSLLDWRPLGVESDGADSTLWLGTKGAYTPCHYDSYGFNLHAQLRGRKRWLLFPPKDSKLLKPTRIPYEESSIFASIDVRSVPKSLNNASPRLITLEPGQVLFLPPHWWHFVQCVSDEAALSVNTWIPVEGDNVWRKPEAVTRAVVALLDEGGLLPDRLGLLPSEPDIPLDRALQDLQAMKDGLEDKGVKRAKVEEKSPTDDALQKFLSKMGGKGSHLPVISLERLRKELIDPARGVEYAEKSDNSEGSVLHRHEFLRRLINSVDSAGFFLDS